jgi:hypothetical protein
LRRIFGCITRDKAKELKRNCTQILAHFTDALEVKASDLFNKPHINLFIQKFYKHNMNTINSDKKELSPEQREELLGVLIARFEKNMNRHKDLEWAKVQTKLEANTVKLWSLSEMERTGGEPDVVGYDKITGDYIFYDCSTESPKDRRNVCYDREALESRKEFKPKNTAMDMAAAMGVEILTEEQYQELQELGNFDTKTSSWLRTPPEIRKLGGAIFADRRYDHVFVYHNGADSYYGVRGFRALLRV